MSIRNESYLYEQIAKELSTEIRDGVYAIGDQIPSLRYISEQYEVSMATAIQAYSCLEQAGLIESRPKSGYYVSYRESEQLEEPVISKPKLTPVGVNVGHIAMSLVNESRQSGLIKLGAAVPEPALLPLGNLSRALAGTARRNGKALASYYDANGSIELRTQIVRLMKDGGVRCTADDIIITNGCLEALGLALRAVAKHGDTIITESPTYFGVLQVIESLNMKVLEVSTHASKGIELDILKRTIDKRKVAACVLMPTFNNPIGSSMPDENKRQLVKLLNQSKIPLIEDDVYGSLSYEQKRPKAAKSYDNTGNVLYCSSFSKTVSPGLRIGWILAGQYKEQVYYQKFLDNITTAIHPQLTLAEFISKGGYRRCTRHSARIYRQRMEQLRRFVTDYFPSGTRITNPKGGFLLWVELPKRYNCLELYRKALDKKIAITPGVLFSAQEQYKNHIRLSCGFVDSDQVRNSIKLLAKLL